MAICKFWLKGHCRFGETCRNEHPPQDGFRNDNRFAALQTPEQSPSNNNGRSHNALPAQIPSANRSVYSLTKEGVIADLTTEQPQWILSAYGPGLKAPRQLFGGPDREQSFEEVRMRHFEAHVLGNPGLAIQYENDLINKARLQGQAALNNIGGALDYVRQGDNEHPNRIDICTGGSAFGDLGTQTGSSNLQQPTSGQTGNSFSQANQQQSQPSGVFGQPAALGQKPNPFGMPGLSGGSTGAGAPFSQFGARPNPFNQSPQVITTPFAPATQPTPPNPFGAPSQQNKNPFGSLAEQGQQNPFGSSNQTVANPFGPPAEQSVNSFRQPAQQSGSSPFGQPEVQQHPNPFASTAAPPNPTPFSPTQPVNPFGTQTRAAPSNPFGLGQPNGAYNPNQPQSGPNTTEISNPFGRSEATNPQIPSSTLASVPPVAGTDPYPLGASFQHDPLQAYASSHANQRLAMFKGKQVVYKDEEAGVQNRDGTWEKIWFPKGPPPYYKDTELEDNAYSESTKSAFIYQRNNGLFEGLVMPLLPPKREWCLWDF